MIDVTPITPQLFIASQMDHVHAEDIEGLGIDFIISMIGGTQPPERFGAPPFKVLWLRTFDNFFTPIPMKKLRQGVMEALPYLEKDKKVLVFCREGKRRSVTMASSILIAQGMSADEAMRLIKEKRAVADPFRFYVKWRIKKFEKHWKKRYAKKSKGDH